MTEPRQILAFESVTILARPPDMAGVQDVNLILNAGEIALVCVPDESDHLPLADAAEGLLAPDSGTISFIQEKWTDMSAHCEAEMRGRIRRVFDGEVWISNLDLLENIILAECHHTSRPRAALVAEAEHHARALGLSGIPPGRTVGQHSSVLHKLEIVRALMGRPDLIIIDRYNLRIPRAGIGQVTEALLGATARNAAVLWMTSETHVWHNPDLAQAKRFVMDGTAMVPETRTAT